LDTPELIADIGRERWDQAHATTTGIRRPDGHVVPIVMETPFSSWVVPTEFRGFSTVPYGVL